MKFILDLAKLGLWKNFIINAFITTLTINAQYEGYSVDSWNKQVKIEEMFSNKIDKSSFKSI